MSNLSTTRMLARLGFSERLREPGWKEIADSPTTHEHATEKIRPA